MTNKFRLISLAAAAAVALATVAACVPGGGRVAAVDDCINLLQGGWQAVASAPDRIREAIGQKADTTASAAELPSADTSAVDSSLVPPAPVPDSIMLALNDSLKIHDRKAAMIVVDKSKMTLTLMNLSSEPIMSFPVSTGTQYGDKQTDTDNRTPEGVFKVTRIEDSTQWEHIRGDGRVEYGAYGPFFIRLDCPPLNRIGIHGTNKPHSIGHRASEGCIRCENRNLMLLMPYVYVGMPVVILPSEEDISANAEYMSVLSKSADI